MSNNNPHDALVRTVFSDPRTRSESFAPCCPRRWSSRAKRGRKGRHRAESAHSDLSRVRGLEVPEAARKRILAEKDRERLEMWHERAILASSIVDELDAPS